MDQERTLQDILETVAFIRDHAAMKEDIDRLDLKIDTVKEDFNRLDLKIDTVKEELMTHMDGFIGLHQKLDLELVALKAKYDRLESYILQLAKHAQVELEY